MLPDASALLERLQCRELSVETLARECLARIAEREPLIRAWSHLDPAGVLAQARELDKLGPDPERRPLFGLPIAIKDVLLTRDMPTQYNSALFAGHQPQLDAACVAILRAAGALIFGKTETVEFAATGRPALTRNPRDIERTPGGSSSGSAAVVADGHVPLSLGTQTGGSMLRPASFCGVWAFKPTWNLVSTEGAKRFATSLDTLGWFGRSAADLQLLLDLLGGPLAGATLPARTPSGLRIAFCRSPAWPNASADMQQAMARAETLLTEAGATVEDLVLPPSFDGLIAAQRLIMRAEGGSAFLDLQRLHGAGLDASLRDCVANRDGIDAAMLCRAYDEAAACRREFDALASGFDAVLTPSSVGVAPLGLVKTGDYVFNAMWSLLHVPCVNVPGLNSEEGLPLGLTLTGPRYADRRVLAAAAAVGTVLGGGVSACRTDGGAGQARHGEPT